MNCWTPLQTDLAKQREVNRALDMAPESIFADPALSVVARLKGGSRVVRR